MSYAPFRLILDLCFAGCLLWSAHTDRRSMLITNSAILCMCTFALMHISYLLGMGADVYEYVCALLIFVPLYISWHLDVIGGGDVKLMGAMCLYMGLYQSGIAFAVSFAVLLVYSFYHKKRHHKRGSHRRIILGPALALGGIVALIFSHVAYIWY